MVTVERGPDDDVVEQIKEALARYEKEHPKSKASLYRQNSASVRVRIVDPEFAPMPRADRHERAWQYLSGLSEGTQADISMLVLISPNEMKQSFANFEFEDPAPSRF
jgi:hypothetical protein